MSLLRPACEEEVIHESNLIAARSRRATPLNDLVSVVKERDQWTWFYGARQVFAHPADDGDSIRMFSAQLICQGACQQVEIIQAFAVSASSVKRSVKQYREEGIPAFFREMWQTHRIACITYHKYPQDAWPEEAKFERLAPSRKRLLDTVKMLAYRAETSLVGIVREALSRG